MRDYLSNDILDIAEFDANKHQEDDKTVGFESEIEKYYDSIPEVRENEVISGTIVGFTDREVLVDIGFKSEGVVPRSEFLNEVPEEGQSIDVYLVRLEDRKGNIILSKEKADFEKRWSTIKTAFEEEKIIKGVIVRRIKGGMIVDLGTVQAFLPGSQIDIKPITNFDELIGSESEFKIVKFNEMRQNIVLSRKAILTNDLMEKRQEVLAELEVGMVLEGIVKNITDFGAFIDLGGIDGLLHITDITWGRINHPGEKLSVGETVSVKVIDFDVEKVRVSLGMKQLTPEPWESIDIKYPVDKVIKGKVVNMMNYGAFVELEEGVEGLIHVSEMSWIKHVKHPSDIFSLGDEVEAKILSLDKSDKKISLGIKQLQDNPWDTMESKYSTGSIYKGIVKNLTQFGAFVELEEGIEGLVHVNDMSWTQIIKHPKQLIKKNDEIDVKVLEISTEDRKLSLGIKQLEEDPWESIKESYPENHKMNCEVIKVLDRGIIFTVDSNIEGLAPTAKNISDDIKEEMKKEIKAGNKYDVTVIKIDSNNRKIILSIDQFADEMAGASYEPEQIEPDKIEVPQDIIDKIKDSKED
ncbi:MAG: 30S ribosomal protein S1 [Candidatus Marinimicrobia bacterium]|nr:30S ribosomal protein S1 [Candidatus Neomarinimicrobiota bacterium]